MDKYPRLPFLGLLKVSLLGVAFPLLLTNLNWAQANTKQDNSPLYAQTIAPSTPQPSKSAEGKNTNSPSQDNKAVKPNDENLPWFVAPIGLVVVPILYWGVFLFNPLLLLWIPAELKIPKIAMIPEFKLSIGFVIWLKYRPRVLDAWVRKHINTYQHKFDNYETVSRRKNYVSLPVDLLIKNKYEEHNLIAEDLRKSFRKDKRLRLLIWGDGGTGKTTIACRIANWAMAEDKEKRLTEHLMLPVLIEQEPKSPSGENIKVLMEDIVGQIQDLTDAQQKIVDNLLVEQLLQKQRILLIFDRFSEMSGDTRDKINPKNFPANALVVTSRTQEANIGDIDIKINTLPLDGVELTYFIKQYLKKDNKWKLFENDQENFLKECAKLAGIVGDKKTIIVLLAKLYADRMVNAKENLRGTKDFPDNIPDLIVEYLKTLNDDAFRKTNKKFHTVEENAKLIAWKCLEQEYKPSPLERESIVAVYGKEKENSIVKHFHEELHLIQLGGSDTIRFESDTLAEYLAGLYLVENYENDEGKWNEFIQKVDPDTSKRKEIKGFLLAVRECCITKGKEKVPSFVVNKLGELAGVDLKAEKQEKQRQRIDHFIGELSNSELNIESIESKVNAVKELQKMAATDEYALNALLEALKNEVINVREAVAKELGNLADKLLNNNLDEVLDKLVDCLKKNDEDSSVRSNVVEALSKLCNKFKSRDLSRNLLDALLKILKDKKESPDLHKNALKALANLHDPSKQVLEQLLSCLQNQDYDLNVRQAAVEALGKFGEVFEGLFDELLARLQDKDDDPNVRQAVAEALGNLRDASERILNELLARLQDKDDDPNVRQAAAEALGNLRDTSEPVLNELLARLQDKGDDLNVRETAAQVLDKFCEGKLGNASELVLERLFVLVLNEDEYTLRNYITVALSKFDNALQLVIINKLLPHLQDKDCNVKVRCNAVEALGKLGNASEQVLDELLARLQDKNDEPNVRRNAVEALVKLGNASERVLDELLARLQDKNDEPNVRRNAVEALVKLGNASERVLDELLARLQDKNDEPNVRCNAAEALGNLGNASERVLDELLARLQDKNDEPNVRCNAAEALGNLGNASERVLDELSARSEDRNDYRSVLKAASKTLESLKKLNNKTLP